MPRRTLVVVLVLLAVVVPRAAASPAVSYHWPVAARPVRGFDAPASPYAAGHRGVDLPVAVGEPIRAMAPGEVGWVGSVAGQRWVTIVHPDGIRTSYGPVEDLRVVAGDAVGPDVVVATAAGTAHGPASTSRGGRLHVGARRGDVYLDPATLVAGATRRVATLVGPGEVAVPAPARPGRATLVPGVPPSPHHLVVLAGFTSATGHLPLDPVRLGYGPDDVTQFGYAGLAPDGRPRPYGARDTWQRVHRAASMLADQLRARWAAHPGQAVDLVGHSLGGLVGLYYLLVLHDPADPTLPPIGRVATIASPLQGADAADVVTRLQDDPWANLLLELASAQVSGMDDDAPVLADLRTDSEVTRAIADAWARHLADPYGSPLAAGTDVLTVGALLDPVVPEHRSALPNAPHEVVVDGHSGAPRHDRTAEVLAAFLAGDALPGRGVEDHLAGLVAPLSVYVSLVEQVLGVVVEAHL